MVSTFPAKKNAAFTAVFPILDADGDLVTGAAGLDSEISKDKGTFTDCSNEATELATNSGMYYLDLTADEMNADVVAVIVKTSTSGAKTTALVFYTAAQTLDETDAICDAIKAKTDIIGASVALETGGNIATILADTNELQTDWANGGRLDNILDARSSHAAADVWAVGTRALTDKAGFSLSAAGIDSIVDEVMEGSTTLREAIRLMSSALFGKLSGGGTTELTFRDIGDTKNRLVVTVDANKNRTAVTKDAT